MTTRVTVDGVERELREGRSLLDALLHAGVEVPHLCHDARLAPAGACRLCVVEVDGTPGHVTACTARLGEGQTVRTTSPDLEESRRTTLRLLAEKYPAEDGSGTDPLHVYFERYGVRPRGTRSAPADLSHPYIRVDLSRCIDCLRCVRICRDVQGQDVWHLEGRGEQLHVAPDGPSLVESSCVSCGACVDTCPSGALEDHSVLALGRPDSWTRTTCPYCGTGCEMDVGTRDGRITRILPAPDSKVSKGHLCVKGRYAFEFVHAEDRVAEPMLRRGGKWERVSWEEALSFTAVELQRVLGARGPGSVGVLGSARATNEDNYVAQKLARVVLGTNNVDCCARVCHAPTAAAMNGMLGTGAATNSFDDIEQSACFLVCGANPTENHPIVGARIRQRVRRGARLVVIDPRRTELARIADVHLRAHPGKNVPLLHAMTHVILAEGLFDSAFVANRVEGIDELRRLVEAFSPDAVAAECGVLADDIRAAARLFAASGPAMAFHGLGVTEHTQGTDGVRCLANLALLTGNVGKRGAGLNPLRGQNNVQGAAHMGCEPSRLTGYATLEAGRERFEPLWGAPLPSDPGLTLPQMIDAARAGTLGALLTVGYDILLSNANTSSTEEALGALELLVVQDLFLDETARRFAHVFLPAVSSFEKDGTFMNSERRVQRVRRAVPPIGEARPDWEILCDLAKAMGHEGGFSFETAEDVWNEIRRAWPLGAGISYARLEHGGLQWPCPTEDHPGTEVLHAERFPAGARARLALVDYRPTDEVPDAEYPLLLITGRTLHHFNAGTMTGRSRSAELRQVDALDVSPADAARLGLSDGARVTVRSRYGSARLPVVVTDEVRQGELFATFHVAGSFLNRVTSPRRDRVTGTPEYKVTAVRLDPDA
ncbi:MAG TPA: formate dehydrogenase subunit alpha [Polyangiaceae bacterium]